MGAQTYRVVAPSGTCGSSRASISKPADRNSRIHSPCDGWNSTLLPSGHATRVGPEGAPHEAFLDGIILAGILRGGEDREHVVGQDVEPATRAQEAGRLGHPRLRVGPQDSAVLADREVERGIGAGNRSAFPWISGNSMPCSRWRRAAVSSCFAELSIPTGLAPRRAIHADTYPGAAPELDGVEAIEVVGEHLQLGLGDAEQAPGLLSSRAFQSRSPGPT